MNSSRESLTRAIGTFGLAAGIINITIGGGIFRLPALVASSLGTAAPIAYVVCAIAMGLIVICIADAGKRVTLTGGPYAYVGTAFGPYAGFLSGVLLWMLGTFATAAVSTVFASSIAQLMPALSGSLATVTIMVAAFVFWLLINLRGVTLGVQLNTIATIAKLFPLILIAAAGMFFVRAENLVVGAMPAATDVARTSLVLVFAFAGIEAALIPSGEVRDSARTVPRAIALAMLGITALYIALQVVAQGILGNTLAQSAASPLADAAGASLGSWARSLLLVGASISMFGYLGGMTLAIPRIVYALARDGFLPRVLGGVDAAHRVPQAAIVAQAILTLALAITGTFEKLAIFANVSALALYFGCAAAAWKLGQSPIVPVLACGVIVWLLTGLTVDEWIGFGTCILVASGVYFTATRSSIKHPLESRQ
jgi:APA family basic amino acid/polyamine antiporter